MCIWFKIDASFPVSTLPLPPPPLTRLAILPHSAPYHHVLRLSQGDRRVPRLPQGIALCHLRTILTDGCLYRSSSSPRIVVPLRGSRQYNGKLYPGFRSVPALFVSFFSGVCFIACHGSLWDLTCSADSTPATEARPLSVFVAFHGPRQDLVRHAHCARKITHLLPSVYMS